MRRNKVGRKPTQIMARNFPNLREKTDKFKKVKSFQLELTQRPTLRNIIVKLSKVTKILKVAREKRPITFKAAPIRLSMVFSAET